MAISSRPMIIHGDNIIFNNRFKVSPNDKSTTEIFDPRYFITKYGLFIPTNRSEFQVLDYLKNPTETKQKRLSSFTNFVYLVSPDGNLYSLTIGKKTKFMFFVQQICTGPGVKSIHDADGMGCENAATILFGTDTYEEFINIYNKVYDPHGHTTRMTFQQIKEMLAQHGIVDNILDSDLVVGYGDFDDLPD
jgi:hypothetical protein